MAALNIKSMDFGANFVKVRRSSWRPSTSSPWTSGQTLSRWGDHHGSPQHQVHGLRGKLCQGEEISCLYIHLVSWYKFFAKILHAQKSASWISPRSVQGWDKELNNKIKRFLEVVSVNFLPIFLSKIFLDSFRKNFHGNIEFGYTCVCTDALRVPDGLDINKLLWPRDQLIFGTFHKKSTKEF